MWVIYIDDQMIFEYYVLIVLMLTLKKLLMDTEAEIVIMATKQTEVSSNNTHTHVSVKYYSLLDIISSGFIN